nr:hypothetical protein YSBCXYJI_YSBCXYJI_CDS_0016 [Caudoviricetes sp.]
MDFKFNLDVLLDGVRIFTLEDKNTVSDLNLLLNNAINDKEDVSSVSIKLVQVADLSNRNEKPQEEIKITDNNIIGERLSNKKIKESLGDTLKEMLVSKYKFNPKDISVDNNNLVLFSDPENWEVELDENKDKNIIDTIAKNIYQLAKDEHKINESLNDKNYVYILRHGFGPSTVPKTVDIIDFEDLDNGRTKIWLDRPLTKEEINYYDIDDKVEESLKNKKNTPERYEADSDGGYTIWSASDLAKEQIPLVRIKIDDNGDYYAEAVGDDEFDKESFKIANQVIATAKKGNKDLKYVLTRLDKTLNHNDPFFSVEFDRSITNSGLELMAAQALRTLRDDLKATANNKNVTEETIIDKFTELTGVDYATNKILDKDQYDQILILMLKDPKDRFNYIRPEENPYIQKLRDLTDDLIEKVNLKHDPNFYN